MYSLDEWVIRRGEGSCGGQGGGGEVEMRATVVLDDNTRMRGLWGGGSKRKHSDLDGEVRVRRRPCRDNTEQTIESLTKGSESRGASDPKRVNDDGG